MEKQHNMKLIRALSLLSSLVMMIAGFTVFVTKDGLHTALSNTCIAVSAFFYCVSIWASVKRVRQDAEL